ncbi:MAG: chaperone modulator CbpM [Gammaproteobacteria bacterium]
MSNADTELLTGVTVDGDTELTLAQLCSVCTVHAEHVVELVQEGVIEPSGGDAGHWRFSSASLRRARVAIRLQTDLGVNLPGVALALQLMDELDALQRQMSRMPSSHSASRGARPQDVDVD